MPLKNFRMVNCSSTTVIFGSFICSFNIFLCALAISNKQIGEPKVVGEVLMHHNNESGTFHSQYFCM